MSGHAGQAHLRTLAETRADNRLRRYDGDQLTQAEVTLSLVAGAIEDHAIGDAAAALNAYHRATGCDCEVRP